VFYCISRQDLVALLFYNGIVFLLWCDLPFSKRNGGGVMDYPCKHCEKANMDYVSDFEYGCENPCEKAKDFYKRLGNKLDELLDRVKEMGCGE
jgi:hypothetical protein